MSCLRPQPAWAQPPQHSWSLDEIKLGNLISSYSLNDIITQPHSKNNSGCCITFGRIADNPTLVDIVTAHESCSRIHARIAFDNHGTPWLRDLGSGNGSYVNEKLLPPEACGKEDSSNKKGSRGVVLYPGDALRFGASTRLYILEGPEEFERGKIKLLKQNTQGNPAIATQSTEAKAEGEAPANDNGGCSWGMADDIANPEENEEQNARTANLDHSNLPPLPSIESFFYAPEGKYDKIPSSLHQLHGTYNTKLNKLQSIQKESSRIMQKENMGVELTDGQRGQLSKNQERISALEKDVASLQDRIEDGMFNVIHGKERIKKRRHEKKEDYDDDGEDDFYDRTASSSKKQRTDDDVAESEESLIQKWKKLLEERANQQQMVSHALAHCTALQKQIDDSKEDDEDAFFLQNDLDLANEKWSKATKSVCETDKELDELEYLLKVVNPKLSWDRKDGLMGTDLDMMRDANLIKNEPAAAKLDNTDLDRDDAIMMPPPPPLRTASAEPAMPPPQPRMLGPTPAGDKPDDSLMPPPPSTNNDEMRSSTEPKQKKRLGPKRPPVNIQGTLAALKQASTSSASGSTNDHHQLQTKKSQLVPNNPKEDVWKAPVDQDGSGRTALHDKFKGRY